MKSIVSILAATSDVLYWTDRIEQKFGIKCHAKEPESPLDPIILRQSYLILDTMPAALVKDCGVYDLIYSVKMGPSRAFYPNHGFYIHNSVTLNSNIFYNPDMPDDFFDPHGYFLDRPSQTIIHEFAHGYDAAHDELSKKDPWLKLSGWSETPKPGLKRLLIEDPGTPRVLGEWFYKPDAEFTRFYAKRNPWDDFADSFAFFVGNLKDKVPEGKQKYFENLLNKYYHNGSNNA